MLRLRAEADTRYGAFDFRQAYEDADADLQELLDSHESLPFRRRGYERDGMLRCVVLLDEIVRPRQGRLTCACARVHLYCAGLWSRGRASRG